MQLQDLVFNLKVRDHLDANWLTVDDCDQADLDRRITQERLGGCNAGEAALNIAVAYEAR